MPDARTPLRIELRHWHLCRTLRHQFALVARRSPPETPPAAERRAVVWTPYGIRPKRSPGLAAVKHAQHQAERRATGRSKRRGEGEALARRFQVVAPERPHIAHGRGGGGFSVCTICQRMVRLDGHACAAASCG